MSITVASWNIKKSGISSTFHKQTKVNHFIDKCIELNVPVIFLCEVHSAQLNDYIAYLNRIFREYNVYGFSGNNNTDYIVLTQKSLNVEILEDVLKVLNGEAILLQTEGFSLILSHFKLDGANFSKKQLTNAATFLQELTPDSWAIIGDMNWDYRKSVEFSNDFNTSRYTCWNEKTQKNGGILDWCLAGESIKVTPFDLTTLFPSEIYDMSGPDYKPTIFALG